MKLSMGASFCNVTITLDGGKWETISIPTTRKDKNGHLARRSDFEIMGDVRGIAEKARSNVY